MFNVHSVQSFFYYFISANSPNSWMENEKKKYSKMFAKRIYIPILCARITRWHFRALSVLSHLCNASMTYNLFMVLCFEHFLFTIQKVHCACRFLRISFQVALLVFKWAKRASPLWPTFVLLPFDGAVTWFPTMWYNQIEFKHFAKSFFSSIQRTKNTAPFWGRKECFYRTIFRPRLCL